MIIPLGPLVQILETKSVLCKFSNRGRKCRRRFLEIRMKTGNTEEAPKKVADNLLSQKFVKFRYIAKCPRCDTKGTLRLTGAALKPP